MVTDPKGKIKTTVKRKRSKKKNKLTPDEKIKRAHIREIQGVFRNAGFKRIAHVSGKGFTFDGRSGELDDIFLYENIVVIAEYTTAFRILF